MGRLDFLEGLVGELAVNALDYRDFDDRMSDVMRLVHLAARLDSVDVEEWRGRILRIRRMAYEEALTIEAGKVGCEGRAGRLGEGEILSQMNEESQREAEGIVNTFNYYLAGAIVNIRSEVPRANRYVYASRLEEWERNYWAWKEPQIQENTILEARSQAQEDFYAINNMMFGSAKLEPTSAECPVCKGWVARGIVPMRVALNNPPPYHPNCVAPGEKVLMEDGTEKPIEQVKEGDLVATRHGNCQVSQVYERRAREALYSVSVGDRVVRLTGDHPVLTAQGWKLVRDLRVGDEVRMVFSREKIKSIKTEQYEGPVYNLKTENEEYVVNGIVVHNCPHGWDTRPEEVAPETCPQLWMGGERPRQRWGF